MTGVRAISSLDNETANETASPVAARRSPARQWTLWLPIVLAAILGMLAIACSDVQYEAGVLILLAAIQAYFVVWCMIVGAVPVGARWFYSEFEPVGFSAASIIYMIIALALGFASVFVSPSG